MRSAPTRAIAGVLLVLYTAVIARLTLFPASSESGTFGTLDRVVTRLSGGGLDWNQIEVLANVALFVPAGFLLAIVLGRTWLAVALGVLASAAIEYAQYRFLPSRVPSWADVEHNGLGALVGGVLALPVVRWLRRPVPVTGPGRSPELVH